MSNSVKDRKNRILDVAIDLAQEGGFENVRQRDVADQAGIALGTLYKSFTSKENILSAALEREARELEHKLKLRPPVGDTPAKRLYSLFNIMTRGMCRKPKYARAVIRAMASGQSDVTTHIAGYYGQMNDIIVATMRGGERRGASDKTPTKPSAREDTIATLLQEIWFTSLVSWSAGLRTQADVVDHMRQACELLIEATKSMK